MANPNYDWVKTLVKALFATVLPLLPSIVNWLIPELEANKWGYPLVAIAIAVGALKGLKNYLKNA